ncbi:DUF1428 family protein [Seonamhaeicola aphaedonensis]|uniref:DUF1428 family protein n=1 Tax=Seonamhaeicola aphaedonensis TaxID=1461338 RepID=UPI000E308DA4|nr:DUF1428 family protein [Seonamhaeicola aphaedonensis]
MANIEYVGYDLHQEGTRSFADAIDEKEDEVIVLGSVAFLSREVRERANEQFTKHLIIAKLIVTLINPENLIFDPGRKGYQYFNPSFSRILVKVESLQITTSKKNKASTQQRLCFIAMSQLQ